MKKIRTHLYIFLLTFVFVSCFEEENPTAEEKSFFKIYNNNFFNQAFEPIDVKQTTDGGFLILARKTNETNSYSDIYLLKTDKTGKIEKEITEIGTNAGHPVGPLQEIGGAYYFFCLDKTDTRALLVRVLPDATVESTTFITNTTGEGEATRYLPLACGKDGNNLLLLSYDNLNRTTVADAVTPNGSITDTQAYSIGEGDDYIQDVIASHFNQQSRQYPFAIGRVPGGSVYFNGFIDYTFTLAFVNLNQDVPFKTVRGTQADGGVEAILAQSANQFTVALFNFNQLYYSPVSALQEQNIDDIIPQTTTYAMAEVAAQSRVSLTTMQIENENYILFASTSRSNQIVLHVYQANGTLVRSKYLGFSNPYQAQTLTPTTDNGLLISGATYVAGRFKRICLFKLSEEEVKGMVKK
jgi:hypothetical protein